MLDELSLTAPQAARRLLGCHIERTLPNKQKITVKICETESYTEQDQSSHSYKGITKRNKVMFGPPGFAYVYIIYGMHFCLNVSCGPTGAGEAVLIRAADPLVQSTHLGPTNGPAKLCKALLIDKSFDGHNLSQQPLRLIMRPEINPKDIITTERIGISKATHRKWRFYIKDSQFVSRK